jgi:hypothetical protein
MHISSHSQVITLSIFCILTSLVVFIVAKIAVIALEIDNIAKRRKPGEENLCCDNHVHTGLKGLSWLITKNTVT